ncbi:MAG: PAS domain S-box protein [Deltaproteobacteria bacterium]|nr:PAS domain S-box protein [Deltaproteobacteria bacterium]
MSENSTDPPQKSARSPNTPGLDAPIRVLLVEDNRADYLYTRALLRTMGTERYDLDWVSSYTDGQREIARGIHDVYLLDYSLDEGTGLDLLREAIARGFRKPMILLTAYGDDNIDIEAIRAGAADYVMKGEFDARLLKRSIRYALSRSQTLEELRLSQERYALAVQGANDAIWDWDLRRQQIYLSPRWHAMFGLPPETRETVPPSRWFDEVHPEDLAALKAAIAAHIERDSPHFEHEFRLHHQDGRYRWVTARGLVVRDALTGVATRIAGSMTDTSERTMQEHQLRAILTSMVEGVIAVDGRSRVLHLNEVAANLLGTTEDAAIGKPIAQISRLTEIVQMLNRTVREGRKLRGELHLSRIADTEQAPSTMHHRDERILELRTSPLHAEKQDVSGGVLVIHDITEIRRLEGLQREFVANVSHELKTPLSAILGMVDTLIDDVTMPAEKQRNFLGRIGDQSERLSALVNDLLTLSRVESLERRIERHPVDLRAVSLDSAYRLEPSMAERGLSLDLKITDEPVIVGADEELLRQVVDNLLTNAIKYTPEGGDVWLRVQRHGGHGTVEVEDTGIGIAPQHHGRIFERFYRVDKARSRSAGGTGLGLAIVKNVMLALDGNISVESTPGRGSTFSIRLPLADSVGEPPSE